MHAIHIIAGLRATDGGPAYSVPRLCRALAAAGTTVDLMTVSETSPQDHSDGNYRERRFAWDGVNVPLLRAVRRSSSLAHSLRTQARIADVVHDHGLWLLPNVYAGREAGRARRPLIVAPRGMLSPTALSFSKTKKRIFWLMLQRSAVLRAACFHATSAQEYEEIRAFGLKQPVAIVPNGIDMESKVGSARAVSATRTALSLGRLHPKKGLETLLHAWAKVELAHPNWRLRIIGSSENGYDAKLRTLAANLNLSRVSIEGPVYNADKALAYAEADLFVLSTLNENFAVTVAEALSAGVPVISTKGAPWKGLAEQGCGWWVDLGIDALSAALDQALAMPRERLTAMGEKGRSWMQRDFSWDKVASDMLHVYQWLSHGGSRPSVLQFG
jgi:glycosyltransferase involved in cell wall biosynthesis